MSRVLRFVNLAVAVILIVLAALVYWYVWRPLPQVSGTLQLPVAAAAQISRDARGVPHITAQSIDDAMFLQGYVHAQDRLWQMDALRRLAAGELAEVVGAAALESDHEARRMLMRRSAELHARTLHPSDRRVLAAYARGVNHFMETHRGRMPVEFTLLGYDPRPWTMVDSILAGLQMYRGLTSTWKDEVLKQSLIGRGDKQKVDFLFPVATGDEVQLGSNSWVISGKLTASGKPVLANDTHLDWSFPGPWYMVHVKAPELNITGFSLPGLPSVIIGHNERIAWGITNLHYDVQDMYVERLDAQTGRYVYKGQLLQARAERETIRVKNAKSVELVAWVTVHGPIFRSAENFHMALRWMGNQPGGFQSPFLEVAQAKNWEEFQKAWSRFTGPGSNVTYADVDGNIGYHAVGKFPIRRNYNGDVPSDGSTGEFEWDGFVPFDELPSAYNPPSGMLVTANQNPFGAAYKYRLNGNFASHYRSSQIEARLRARTGWKPEEMLSIQTDLYSAFSHRLAREIYKAWQQRGRNNPELSEAAELLNKWDGQMRYGAPEPFLIALIFQHLRKAVAEKASPGQGGSYELQMAPAVLEKLWTARPKEWFADYDRLMLQCFVDAIDEGKRLQGGNVSKWDYGRYTEYTLSHPVISRVPYVGRYFNIGPVPMAGASTTVKQTTRRHGPAMRFVADLADWENSLANITIGQSGQPLSSHFRDQWKDYYYGRSYPMPFGAAPTSETLTIQPLR